MRLVIKPEHAYSDTPEMLLFLTGNEYIWIKHHGTKFKGFDLEIVTPRKCIVHPRYTTLFQRPQEVYETLRKSFETYVPFGGKIFMFEEKLKAGTKEFGWDFKQFNWRKSVAAQERARRKKAEKEANQALQASQPDLKLVSNS